MNTGILLRAATLIDATGERTVDILIEEHAIKKIGKITKTPPKTEVIDTAGKLVFPGLIDCHVHFREPGYEYKATMATESKAAIAGSVTTVCEMPNTDPPTVTIAALADKVRRSEAIDSCDIRFFFGATEPAHLQALTELWTGEAMELRRLKLRCSGLKLYLDHSTGNQGAPNDVINAAFALCARHHIPLVGHCEDPALNAQAREKFKDSADVAAHSKMRPEESEAAAVEAAINLVRRHGAPFHVAHLTCAPALDLVRKAKAEKLPVTCEVAPHHLFLTGDDYEALGTLAKMNPPLRSAEHRDALWEGIHDGTVDCIATDHAPHTLDEKKTANWRDAPSGVPGVETMLPLLLSVAAGSWPHPTSVRKNLRLEYHDIVRLCFSNPNTLFHLDKKGVAEGAAANLVLIDPNKQWTVSARQLHSKCGWTPYEGWSVTGAIDRVIV